MSAERNRPAPSPNVQIPSLGIYEAFRDAIRAEMPVALATIIEHLSTPDIGYADTGSQESEPGNAGSQEMGTADASPDSPDNLDSPVSDLGPQVGAKLLVRPDAEALGSLGNAELDRVVTRDALGMLDAGISEVRHYGPHGEARQSDISVFVECHARRPHMVIFGAVDFTRALAAQAKLLGYRVTVCDARAVFATKRRFPMADEVVVDWPNRLLNRIGRDLGPRDAVCVLTHDHKFDVPAIVGALPTRVGYLGAMGSRTTHERRTERLQQAGVSDADLQRVMAPIGLDIGGRTPEETAVSIVAEIIAARTGRQAPRLRDGQGRIH